MENDILNGALQAAGYDYGPLGADFAGTIFEDLLYPGMTQQREFGQQVALTKYQNSQAYKDKFNALRDLGINPLTAAESLTGSSSGAAAPSSAVGAGSSSLGALSGAAESVGNIADRLSSAKERNTLLNERKKNLVADTYLKYINAGYNSELAKGMAIANAYLPTEKFLGLMSLDASIDKLHAEYKSIMQGIDESKKRIEELDAQIRLADATGNLNSKLALEAEKRTLLIEAQTTEQKWFNDQMTIYGIDPRNPIENNIFLAGVREGRSSYGSQLGIIRDIQYNNASGQYDADEEHAYSISYSKALAEAYASWMSRPSSTSGLIADSVARLKSLIDKCKKDPSAKEELRKQKEFLSAFSSFKADLKTDLEEKRKAYHEARRFLGRDAVVSAYNQYKNALEAYENMDEDAFEALLLNQHQ